MVRAKRCAQGLLQQTQMVRATWCAQGLLHQEQVDGAKWYTRELLQPTQPARDSFAMRNVATNANGQSNLVCQGLWHHMQTVRDNLGKLGVLPQNTNGLGHLVHTRTVATNANSQKQLGALELLYHTQMVRSLWCARGLLQWMQVVRDNLVHDTVCSKHNGQSQVMHTSTVAAMRAVRDSLVHES